MSEFWKNALLLMEERRIRQVDLAQALDRSKTTICHWINRDTLPQADDAVRIADLLGVSVRYLVTGTRQEGELSPLEKRLLEACRGLSDPMMNKVIKEAVDLRIMAAQERGEGSLGGSGKITLLIECHELVSRLFPHINGSIRWHIVVCLSATSIPVSRCFI